jgi:hypothetical protein
MGVNSFEHDCVGSGARGLAEAAASRNRVAVEAAVCFFTRLSAGKCGLAVADIVPGEKNPAMGCINQ